MDPSVVNLLLDEMKKLGDRFDACFDRLENSLGVRHAAPEASTEAIYKGKTSTTVFTDASSNSITIPYPLLLPAVDTDTADPYELTGTQNNNDVSVASLLPQLLHHTVEGVTPATTALARVSCHINVVAANTIALVNPWVGTDSDNAATMLCAGLARSYGRPPPQQTTNVAASDHDTSLVLDYYPFLAQDTVTSVVQPDIISTDFVKPLHGMDDHIASGVFKTCAHSRCLMKCATVRPATTLSHHSLKMVSVLTGPDLTILSAKVLVFEVLSSSPHASSVTIDSYVIMDSHGKFGYKLVHKPSKPPWFLYSRLVNTFMTVWSGGWARKQPWPPPHIIVVIGLSGFFCF